MTELFDDDDLDVYDDPDIDWEDTPEDAERFKQTALTIIERMKRAGVLFFGELSEQCSCGHTRAHHVAGHVCESDNDCHCGQFETADQN